MRRTEPIVTGRRKTGNSRGKKVIFFQICRMWAVCFTVCAISAGAAGSAVSYAAAAAENPYPDVAAGNWAEGAILEMSAKGILKGYPDGTFRPGETLTYGEFIKMAVVLSGEDPGNAAGEETHWAENYYRTAGGKKLFLPHQIPEVRLDFPIPRSDMALIIANLPGETEIRDYDAIQDTITDISPETRNQPAIIKAYAAGILTGYPDHTFRPDAFLTRAESAVVLQRWSDPAKRRPPAGSRGRVLDNFREAVKNADSFPLDDGVTPDRNVAAVKTYRIVEDPSVYGMSLRTGHYGAKSIDIRNPGADPAMGLLYLVKDGRVVEALITNPRRDGSRSASYKGDISKADYILSVHGEYSSVPGTAELIVNPFKK